jgi:hypothetical protein
VGPVSHRQLAVRLIVRSLWLAVALLTLVIFSGAPGAAAATARPAVVVDDPALTLQSADTGGSKAKVGMTNLTGGELTVHPSLVGRVKNCYPSIDKAALRPSKHTALTITIPKACASGSEKIGINLTVKSGTNTVQLLSVSAAPDEKPDPDWHALRAFIFAFLGALVLASFIFFCWPWLYYWRHTTRRARKTPGGLSPSDLPGLKPNSELPGLKATYDFKDSWVSNVTAAVAVFTGIFASTEVVTAFLGDAAKPALALATVAAAAAAGFTGAGPIFILSTRRAKNDRFTVGGLLGGAVLTLTGAAGGLWVAYTAAGDLSLGGLENAPLTVALIASGALLLLYSYRTLIATLEQGIKPAVVKSKSAEIRNEKRKKKPSKERMETAQRQLTAIQAVPEPEAPRSVTL